MVLFFSTATFVQATIYRIYNYICTRTELQIISANGFSKGHTQMSDGSPKDLRDFVFERRKESLRPTYRIKPGGDLFSR